MTIGLHVVLAAIRSALGKPWQGGPIKKGVPMDTSARATYDPAKDRSLTQKFGESYAKKQGSVIALQPAPKTIPKGVVSDPSPKVPSAPVGTVSKRFSVR